MKKAGSGSNDSLRMFYCGLGKRIRKIHAAADTTDYAFDGMYAVCEFGGHLDLKAKYVYANGMLLARYDASPADSHYYHHDGLGSIMGMTNESGWVEQSYFYDEFGNSLGSWGNVSNRYLYTSQEYDGDVSGAEEYNLRARYYKTGIGRFTSEDPVICNGLLSRNNGCTGCVHTQYVAMGIIPYNRHGLPQVLNPYSYVTNNPLNYADIIGQDRYNVCKGLPIVEKQACIALVWIVCHISEQTCCLADMANCIADLLAIGYETAKEDAKKYIDCPDEIPPKLEECLDKYKKCLGLGAPPPIK